MATDDPVTQLIRQGRDREAAELGSDQVGRRTGGLPKDPITQLDWIMPRLKELVASLAKDDLERPTPCVRFNVGQVLEHMAGRATMFAAAFRGDPPPEIGAPSDLVAFPRAMTVLEDAMRSPGALNRMIDAPFGPVPGETLARFVALDGLVHGWDIAIATGQAYDPPPALVFEVHAFARQAIFDDLRDGDTFAAETAAPSGASELTRLVAFTGRTVG